MQYIIILSIKNIITIYKDKNKNHNDFFKYQANTYLIIIIYAIIISAIYTELLLVIGTKNIIAYWLLFVNYISKN